jgi:hypothetical protein
MNGFTKWIIGISSALAVAAVLAGLSVWRNQSVLERDVTINTTNIAQNTFLIKELKESQTETMREIRLMFSKIEEKLE